MAILITAPIRTGKTLKCIELIFDYLNQGREVYSNIVGLKISGVRMIESTGSKPYDWRSLPNGAVLIFDEAHEHPAFSERDLLKNIKIDYYETKLIDIQKTINISNSEKKALLAETKEEYARAKAKKREDILDIGLSMSLHGHFGIEIVLVTQNPTKLNKDVLSNVVIHHVMRRKFGMDAAMIFTFGEAMTTWGKSTADSALVKTLWKYPKHLYKFYKSSEDHKVQKYFPKKYLAFACIPFLLFGRAYYNASENGFFGMFKKDKEQTIEQPVQQNLVTAAVDPTGEVQEQVQITDTNKDYECRKAINIESPQCAAWLSDQSKPSYNAHDPFNYSYMQQPQQTAFQVFSGCFNGVPYDTQGTILHNAPKDLCKRVMKGDRPFNPYKVNNTNEYNPMAVSSDSTQSSVQAPQSVVEEI